MRPPPQRPSVPPRNAVCSLPPCSSHYPHAMSVNLASILLDSASRRADAVALRLDDAEVSYAILDGASAHVAGLLKARGVEPGDRVGIMLPNVPYFAVC